MKNLFIAILLLCISMKTAAQNVTFFSPNEEVLKISESVSNKEIGSEVAVQKLKELESSYQFNSTDKDLIHKYVDSNYQFGNTRRFSEQSQIERDLKLTSRQSYEKEFSLSTNEKILLGALVFALGANLYLESQNKEVVFSF